MRLYSVDKYSPRVLAQYQDFLTPPSILTLKPDSLSFQKIQSLPDRFEANALEVQQLKAKSKDGTEIPYFVVYEKSELDGKNQLCFTDTEGSRFPAPNYSSLTGKLWLKKVKFTSLLISVEEVNLVLPGTGSS